MSDILNYKFYLNFKNEGSFGRVEITEPVGFDGASFVVEQEAKRYGRDVYRINEEINFNFYKGNYDVSTSQQIPNGTIIYNLTQGYDYLIDCFNRYGFEADVDFEIELDDIVFIPANLDFQNCETDGYSYFACKAVQEQGKQLIKRRADIVTDIFSDEDLDGNAVTLVSTQNILLKAKPITGVSEWRQGGTITFLHSFIAGGGGTIYYNQANQPILSGIENTLSYLPFFTDIQANIVNASYIDAIEDLSEVSINVNFKATLKKDFGDFTNPVGSQLFIVYDIIQDIENPLTSIIDSGLLCPNGGYVISTSTPEIAIDLDFTKENIQIPRDARLVIYLQQSTAFLGGGQTSLRVTEFNIKAKATATALDTVIKGVRYIDVIKANVKRLNGFSVDAARYDVGGEYYDQYAFTGNLIKQRDDLPFPVKFKDLMEDLSELNSDYQTLNDKVYIGQYQDFYTKKEVGAFLTSPDESFKATFNERYAINEFEFKYKTFEQDRDEENTTDAIHTESQWLTSNKQVENTKTIDISYIRDAFKIETARKLAAKVTTSTEEDDKMFLLDVVPIAPNTKKKFNALMQHNITDDGNVQILKDADLPSWALLGFNVGSSFKILSDDNQGTYTVFEIQNTILTLTPVLPATQSFTGSSYTEVEYPLENVSLTNRTNEGLIFFENLLNAEDYSNLRYSIKRNIKPWKPYLKTASLNPDGTFRNTYFKDNGECITQFEGETEPIKENANILNADLGDAILSVYKYETTLLVPFKDMVVLMNKLETINEDKSIGGFVRCIDNNNRVIKLFPSKLDYMPSTEVLILTGEQLFEGNGVDIVTQGDTIRINEVGYAQSELSTPFYEMDGDFLKIYDKDKLPIINPTKFDKVTVNDIIFNSAVELLEVLVGL